MSADHPREREVASAPASRAHDRLIDAVSGLVWTTTAAGVFDYANAQLAEFTGLAPDALRGARWRDVVHPDDVQALERAFCAALAAGRPFEARARVRARDGGYRSLEHRARPVRGAGGAVECWVGTSTDVTEVERATTALRESEQSLQMAMDHVSDGLIVARLDGAMMRWNRAALEMHGFRSMADVTGSRDRGEALFEFRTIDGELLPYERWPLQRVLRGEVLRDVELKITRKDVPWDRYFSFNGSVVAAAGGEPVAFLTVVDQTHRQFAMRALRESEERLRIANEVAGIGTYDTDFLTGQSRVSPEWVEIFGLPDVGLVPMELAFGAVEPEDLREASRRLDEAHARGGEVVATHELRLTRPGGEVRWVSWSGRRFYDATPEGPRLVRGVGACVDVTERRRAEQRLATQNAVSRVLAESATLSAATPRIMEAICESEGWDLGEIWEVDEPAGVLRCAEVWHRPGLRLEDFVAATRATTFAPGTGLQGCVWVERTPRSIADVANDPVFLRRAEAAAGGLVGTLAFPIIAGTEFLGVIDFLSRRQVRVDATMLASYAAIGRQVGVFFERKRAEAARARLQDQLRHAQKMEALGQLSGGIAHDFNNLLAAILGNAQLARDEAEPGSALGEMIEDIEVAARRGRDLVDRIMTFARRQPERRVVSAMTPIVEESARLLRATLPAGVSLDLTIAPDLPLVSADPGGIQQVIINLCTNAWHAMEGAPGTIRLDVDVRALAARDAALYDGLAPGAYVRLVVRDEGRGMDEATMARIFEPFFTTKPAGRGTGLGLAAVHGIVKSHDGAVRVQSAPGQGATFEVLIPPSEAAVAAGAKGAAVALGAAQEVLYVDDEDSLVRVARRRLERLGYRVTAVTRASEALALFAREPARFALVITDMNMPEMSGVRLLRELRAVRPGVPAILVSGFVPDELHQEANAIGVSEVLTKPWTAEELGGAVARALRAP